MHLISVSQEEPMKNSQQPIHKSPIHRCSLLYQTLAGLIKPLSNQPILTLMSLRWRAGQCEEPTLTVVSLEGLYTTVGFLQGKWQSQRQTDKLKFNTMRSCPDALDLIGFMCGFLFTCFFQVNKSCGSLSKQVLKTGQPEENEGEKIKQDNR